MARLRKKAMVSLWLTLLPITNYKAYASADIPDHAETIGP
jgi:hypothetical protein